jgi:inosine-uridine nucleoside N-ribohydrolase
MASEETLYVGAIGAPTNVASAILMEPKIAERIVVVWLGGGAPYWHTASEFNLRQDLHASRVLFDSGVPLVQIPCQPVAARLITTLPEIERYVKGQGALGDYLAQVYDECMEDHFGRSRVIWDISVIAWLINPDWVPTHLTHSPLLTDQVTYSVDASRHFVRTAFTMQRDAIFGDLFRKIARYAGN